MIAAGDTDLLGEPLLRRDAHFPREGVRARIGRWWAPGPRALVIGCNPSSADAMADDPTSRWWNAWFQRFGFNGYDAVNLWPFCTSSPVECRRRADAGWAGEWHDRDAMHSNADYVVELAKAAAQVFVCWGAIAWDDEWIEHVVEQIQTGVAPYPDLWCWGVTAAGAPKHPMARGVHRIPRDQQPIKWRASSG